MIAWGPIIGFVVMDEIFWKENITMVILILWFGPIILFFVWLGLQKYKDIFTLSNTGIVTENHGVINWSEVKVCSWEAFFGTHCILFILKRNKWLYITYSKYSLESLENLTSLHNEIKTYQNHLPESDAFKIVENKVSFFIANAKLAILILAVIGLIIKNIFSDLQKLF